MKCKINLLLILLFFSCKNGEERKINDERKMIEMIINKKVYEIARGEMQGSFEFQELLNKKKINHKNIINVLDSISRNKLFYFSASDTINSLSSDSDIYNAIIKEFIFIPEKSDSKILIVNIDSLSIKKNLIQVKKQQKNKGKYYIGNFQFYRPIYDKLGSRAFVYVYSDHMTIIPITEFEKRKGIWQMKENFPR